MTYCLESIKGDYIFKKPALNLVDLFYFCYLISFHSDFYYFLCLLILSFLCFSFHSSLILFSRFLRLRFSVFLIYIFIASLLKLLVSYPIGLGIFCFHFQFKIRLKFCFSFFFFFLSFDQLFVQEYVV